jgi:hypothetical protein
METISVSGISSTPLSALKAANCCSLKGTPVSFDHLADETWAILYAVDIGFFIEGFAAFHS